MATFFPAGTGTYTLQSSISSTQTTITLTSFKVPVSGDNITMALMNTSIAYGTISPRTTQSEFISFTGITQNADGTATLTGVTRGLNKTYPYTEDSDFKLPHAGATQFILSDMPQVFDKYVSVENTQTISGAKTFSVQNAQTSAGNPVTDNEYARKAYVDAVATGGVSNNRTIVAGIAGETIAVDQLVYLKVSDGRWWLADADTASTVDNVILGIAQGAGTAGNPITSGVLTNGLHTFTSLTLTANTQYYASNTAGGFSSTPGTTEVSLGESQTTTTFLFYPRFDQQLTENQQDALAGTSGTPSNTNRYVTNDDTSSTPTANKVVRYNSNGLVPGLSYTNIFGDGSDGNVVISSNTTLSRDMYYNNLTINSTFTLNTAGYRVFVKGILTNNGTIANNGTNASTSTGGAGGAAGSLKGGGAGANSITDGNSRSGAGGGGGGIVFISAYVIAVQGVIEAKGGDASTANLGTGSAVSSSGVNGTSISKSLGAGAGGNGGNGGGVTPGGTGGTNPSAAAILSTKVPSIIFPMVDWVNMISLGAGAGGASGGLSKIGGSTGVGGGGGGGGGTVIIFYVTRTTSSTPNVSGGALSVGINGLGTSTDGTNGASGTTYEIQIV